LASFALLLSAKHGEVKFKFVPEDPIKQRKNISGGYIKIILCYASSSLLRECLGIMNNCWGINHFSNSPCLSLN